jgi:hypothetical protein
LGDHTNKVKKGQKGENNVQVSRVVSTNYRIFCFFFFLLHGFFSDWKKKEERRVKTVRMKAIKDEDCLSPSSSFFFLPYRSFFEEKNHPPTTP